ncbi:asparaginase [Halosolutus gelatinilyticus]|uniref:asparaginase n=1 Tax=Halosolutus gelatinilyticus TaxID=2931975 RepID=UPI001FF6DF5C|nr:asparaginase [Halosolutus gelatinilyticus]
MPQVRIVSTGGTIASTADGESEGKTPSVTGEDLVDAVPELADHATIEVDEVCRVSGFQMDFENAARIVDAAERAADDGADGVVVTHGTDTMAESAYYLALVLEAELPVVFTGAQRSFDQLGTDGPANLLAAVRAAADDRFRDAGGSYLAFNDAVHAARGVVKSHTSKLETFRSPDRGPVAELAPDGFRFLREPGRDADPIPDWFPGARIDPGVRVELVTNAMGVDGRQVDRALDAGVDGVIVAGTGLGNATAELGAAIESVVDAGVPVVLTSRCHAGTTAGVYGGPGGAKTLLEAGAIAGGDLPPWKARLRAALALSTGDGDRGAVDRVRKVFEGIDSVI